LSNHLGNVLVTVSDKKIPVASTANPNLIDYYNADVVTANDYYPFGMQMPGRKFSQANSSYRYGFNGQEKSDDVTIGNTTAMYWEYDSRIGRRWNVDPVENVGESPYLCFSGSPLYKIDPLGNTPTDIVYQTKGGKEIGRVADGSKRITVITVTGELAFGTLPSGDKFIIPGQDYDGKLVGTFENEEDYQKSKNASQASVNNKEQPQKEDSKKQQSTSKKSEPLISDKNGMILDRIGDVVDVSEGIAGASAQRNTNLARRSSGGGRASYASKAKVAKNLKGVIGTVGTVLTAVDIGLEVYNEASLLHKNTRLSTEEEKKVLISHTRVMMKSTVLLITAMNPLLGLGFALAESFFGDQMATWFVENNLTDYNDRPKNGNK
jgi:hypothetical protein